METPILYILAGPNGIGKSTSTYDIIPTFIPIVNADEIAKQAKLAGLNIINTQEYGNQEALKLIKAYTDSNQSFAIETNLATDETWKFLIDIKNKGFKIHLIFLSTDDIELLNKRIRERYLQGEHFVYPHIVEERYIVGLKLLNHYFNVPDIIHLIDNSKDLKIVAIKSGERLEKLEDHLPGWITHYLVDHFQPTSAKQTAVKDLSSIEEVKKRYNQLKKGFDLQ
ncbi:MAG TPA: zeta toxin family protein [Flavisolibacter sp.]|nr:zeta toxin family protein [Flavisolibacter sp.]